MGLLPEDGHACSTSKRQALGNGNHAKKTKLFVNSRHRELNDTNRVTVNDYEWVPEMPLCHVKNIQVEYAEIPTSFTNVVVGENSLKITVIMDFARTVTGTLEMNQHTETFEIQIPEGYYTLQALVAAMNTAAAAIPLPTSSTHPVHGTHSWVHRTCTIAGSSKPDQMAYLGGEQEVNTDTGGGAYAAGSRYRSTGLIHFGLYETTHQIYIQHNHFRPPDNYVAGVTDPAGKPAIPWFSVVLDPAGIDHIFGFAKPITTVWSEINQYKSTWEYYAPATSDVYAHAPPVEGVTSAVSFGGVPRIAAYTVLYLTCKELGKSEFERVMWGKNSPRSPYPVLARFPMKAGINYMNFFINEFGFQNYQFAYHDITTIEKFTFMWVDDNGKEVNFHGYDHSFTLSVTHGT